MGFSNVSKRSNPKGNSNYIYSLSSKVGNTLIVGRVVDILLDDIDYDKSFLKNSLNKIQDKLNTLSTFKERAWFLEKFLFQKIQEFSDAFMMSKLLKQIDNYLFYCFVLLF